MADLEITFGTNAGEVVGQIDRGTASTIKAEAASGKMAGTSQKLGDILHKLGRSVGEVGHQMGRALGMGGGVGTAIVGFIALHKAIEVANAIMDQHKETVKAAAEAHLLLARNIKTANEAKANTGLSAAKEQGAGIIDLTSRGGGGLDAANALIKGGFGAKEAFSATAEAKKKFGDGFQAALAIAARASNAGGGSLTEGITGLDRGEIANQPLAAARLLAAHRGDQSFSTSELQASEQRLAASKTVGALVDIAQTDGQRALNAQGLIPQGAAAAHSQLAAEKDPLSKIMLDQFNTQSEQLEVMRKIAESQSGVESLLDRLLHGKDSAAISSERADRLSAVGAGL